MTQAGVHRVPHSQCHRRLDRSTGRDVIEVSTDRIREQSSPLVNQTGGGKRLDYYFGYGQERAGDREPDGSG